MNGRWQEIATIVLLLGLMVASWFWIIPVSTSGFVEPGGGDISSQFVPRMAVLIISLALILRLFRLVVKVPLANAEPDPLEGLDRRSFIVLASTAVFVILIKLIGFYPASTLLMLWLAFFLGERRPIVLAAYPSILITVIFVLFEHAFSIGLPGGLLIGPIAALLG